MKILAMTSEDYDFLRELAEQFLSDTFGDKSSRARNKQMETIVEFLDYAESIEKAGDAQEPPMLMHKGRFTWTK